MVELRSYSRISGLTSEEMETGRPGSARSDAVPQRALVGGIDVRVQKRNRHRLGRESADRRDGSFDRVRLERALDAAVGADALRQGKAPVARDQRRLPFRLQAVDVAPHVAPDL